MKKQRKRPGLSARIDTAGSTKCYFVWGGAGHKKVELESETWAFVPSLEIRIPPSDFSGLDPNTTGLLVQVSVWIENYETNAGTTFFNIALDGDGQTGWEVTSPIAGQIIPIHAAFTHTYPVPTSGNPLCFSFRYRKPKGGAAAKIW
jgi:hypothetical protein